MKTDHPIGVLKNIEVTCDYVQDSLGLFQHLSQHSHDHLLFDSAEINSKADLKSLMLVDSCMKITCQWLIVTFDATTDNGKDLLTFITPQFSTELITHQAPNHLELTFPASNESLDEEQRLTAPSPLDAVRAVVDRIKTTSSHPQGLFLGGAFAYDFIASFEKLMDVPESDNICPDFLFYC